MTPHRSARIGLRAIPAALAVLFLTIAFAPNGFLAFARSMQGLSAQLVSCPDPLQAPDSAAVYALTPGSSLYQPLGVLGNVGQVAQPTSLANGYIYNSGTLDVIAWEAGSATPDPTTLLLRSTAYSISSYTAVTVVPFSLSPPVVLLNGDRVADPLAGPIAVRNKVTGSQDLPVDVNPDADPSVPTAWVQHGLDPLEPLPGPHGVNSLAFCGSSADLQQLRVVQAVTTVDAQDVSSARLFLQRFRVPVGCELRWVELAFALGSGFPGGGGYGSGSGNRPPRISVVDLQNVPDPPPGELPAPLVTAQLNGVSQPSWQSHAAFAQSVNLLPGHDYGLLLDTGGTFMPGLRQVTGHGGVDWTSAIFRLSARDTTADDWQTRENRALSFRLIGLPVEALDVPGSGRNATLQLRAQPNPARGAVMLALQGARGPVPMEVLDARGRRVASGTSSGDRWLWTGTDASGRPLPAGVYFVRARGADGVPVSERVVLVR